MKTTQILFLLFLFFCFTSLKAQDEKDALFEKLEMTELSPDEFLQARISHVEKIKSDSVDKIEELGLIEVHNCDQICETYLVEDASGRKMLLPANFDQGILDYLFSPSGDRLIVYASYDGPDYEDYYDYRAEIVVYTINPGKGLDAIQFQESYYSKACSIEELVWMNDQTIGLKIYEGNRSLAGIDGGYTYVKTNL